MFVDSWLADHQNQGAEEIDEEKEEKDDESALVITNVADAALIPEVKKRKYPVLLPYVNWVWTVGESVQVLWHTHLLQAI